MTYRSVEKFISLEQTTFYTNISDSKEKSPHYIKLSLIQKRTNNFV